MSRNFVATGSPPFINEKLSIAEWYEYVASYNFGSIPPSRVVLHHTWKPTVAQWRGLASMKGMQTFYAGKGWTAAPHIYVGPDGIWLATPMSDVGIHAGSGNSGNWNGKWSYSIGLEMVGNYDSKRPDGAVWEGSKAVMAGLAKRLNIAPRSLIYFHRDFSKKSCPGWAVTKEWVWGEVEAAMNNESPPAPPPPGEVGTPTPSQELLMESLLNESYKRGGGYTSEWAFHQYAVEHWLGMPLAPSARVSVDGKEYSYQPFARDTLYNEVPRWGEVKLLSELLGGSIPPSGLGRTLLEATYKACGIDFHADWAFHQYALSAKLGPPVGKNSNVTVDGKEYAYQAFAVDTIFNEVPKWDQIQLLSRISGATDAATVKLREALLSATYQSAGTTYHADWAFHQIALTLDSGAGIGAPLADSHQIEVEGAKYAIQVYALDTLYNKVPDWSDVKRLKEMVTSGAMPSFAAPGMSFSLPSSANWEPPTDTAQRIVKYSIQSASYEPRRGAPISMVILHGDTDTAATALERMATIGTRGTPHYYITLDGTIYQLVDEQYAALHSGMATLGGVWYNTNRISIGVNLECVPPLKDGEDEDEEKDVENFPPQQLDTLRWLLRKLVQRYRLQADDIILSQSLVSSVEEIPPELLMLDIFTP
jgi:hypothetical protein